MDTNTILQDAGLIDTSGKPTTSANFGSAPEPDKDVLDWGDMGMEDDSVFAKPEAKPAEVVTSTQSQSPAASAQPFEATPAQRTQITPQQAHAVGTQNINAMYQQAIIHGLSLRDSEGKALYTVQELEQQFSPMHQAMSAQLQADVVKHQMAPYAQRMAAEHISKQYGVKVDEILDGSSPEVMEDRARTLAKFQRDQKFEKRAAAGTDTAEGGRGMSNAISASYEKLSPQQKIKYGLMRGDS